jgi:Cytochrome b5-like Heme/Steroid binding domain
MTGLRRLVAISLVVFAVAVFYILLAGFSPNFGSGGRSGGNSGGSSPSAAQTPGATAQPGAKTVSAQEVSTHNSASNCWIIISNKVYDVTSYLRSHPGGRGTITPYCGKDATTAFETKDGRGSDHSSRAYTHLDSIYVGDLTG